MQQAAKEMERGQVMFSNRLVPIDPEDLTKGFYKRKPYRKEKPGANG